MKILIKSVLLILSLVVLASLGAMFYLTQMFDPNSYREDIEIIAQEQGVNLSLKGDVSWSWYPNLALKFEDVSVEKAVGHSGETVSAKIESIAVRMAIKPLFSGQLQATGMNLQGTAIEYPNQPPLLVNAQGALNFDQAANLLEITSLEVSVQPITDRAGGHERAQLMVSGKVNLQTNGIDLNVLLAEFNAKQWLQMAGVELPKMNSTSALKQVAMSTKVQGHTNSWQLKDFRLQIDGSTITGDVSQTANQIVRINLHGDQINLDDYLAPSVTVPAVTQKPNVSKVRTNKTNPSVSPRRLSSDKLELDSLQSVALELSLGIDKFQANQVDMRDVKVQLNANNGLVKLNSFKAHLYSGTVQASAELDARGVQPSVKFSSRLESIALLPLLSVMVEEKRISGIANIEMSIKANGDNLAAWQDSAHGKLTAKANTLIVSELDIERKFCELAALTSRKPMPTLAWKGQTTLQDLDVDLAIQGASITIKSIQAGVEELQVNAFGDTRYVKGDFDVKANLRVTGELNPDRACQVRDRWRNRDLPMRCRGNIDEPLGGDVCLPDKDRIDDLLRDEVKSRAQEKLQEKLEEKLFDKLKGSDASPDSSKKAAEQLLRGLFGL